MALLLLAACGADANVLTGCLVRLKAPWTRAQGCEGLPLRCATQGAALRAV